MGVLLPQCNLHSNGSDFGGTFLGLSHSRKQSQQPENESIQKTDVVGLRPAGGGRQPGSAMCRLRWNLAERQDPFHRKGEQVCDNAARNQEQPPTGGPDVPAGRRGVGDPVCGEGNLACCALRLFRGQGPSGFRSMAVPPPSRAWYFWAR